MVATEKFFGVQAVARETGLSRRRVLQLIEERRIRAVKVSGRFILKQDAIDWIVDARKRGEMRPVALPTRPKRCPKCNYDIEEHSWRVWRQRETNRYRRTNGTEVADS